MAVPLPAGAYDESFDEHIEYQGNQYNDGDLESVGYEARESSIRPVPPPPPSAPRGSSLSSVPPPPPPPPAFGGNGLPNAGARAAPPRMPTTYSQASSLYDQEPPLRPPAAVTGPNGLHRQDPPDYDDVDGDYYHEPSGGNGRPHHAQQQATLVQQKRQQRQQQKEQEEQMRQAAADERNAGHRAAAPRLPRAKSNRTGGTGVQGRHITVSSSLTPESTDLSPAQLMAMACETLDWWRIVTLSHQYGPEVTTIHAGEERWTPLHYCALKNKRDYAYQLALQCAAPANAVDIHGDTPLIIAVQNSCHSIVRVLVKEAHADVTIAGRFGLTALHWCAEIENDMEAAGAGDLILNYGADPVAEDEAGKTPLHWAALAGLNQLCSVILVRGGMPSLNNRDSGGRTPLFNAADKGHDQIVRALLHRGASASVTDVNGLTPYEAAKRGGHAGAMKLLKKVKKAPHSGPAQPSTMQTENLTTDIFHADAGVRMSHATGLGSGVSGHTSKGHSYTPSADSSVWDDNFSASGGGMSHSAPMQPAPPASKSSSSACVIM